MTSVQRVVKREELLKVKGNLKCYNKNEQIDEKKKRNNSVDDTVVNKDKNEITKQNM